MSWHSTEYMRSHPQEFLGLSPGKEVNSHICRLFLDIVVWHLPEADVLFAGEGDNGIKGGSHFIFTEDELMAFSQWLQAFSTEASLQFCRDDYGRKMAFRGGELLLCEEFSNREKRTLVQFSFLPDANLLGECMFSAHNLHTILTDYKHLYPDLCIMTGTGYAVLQPFEALPEMTRKSRLEAAARLVVKSQAARAADLQRGLAFGHQEACDMLDNLERMGIVGPEINDRREVFAQSLESLEYYLN